MLGKVRRCHVSNAAWKLTVDRSVQYVYALFVVTLGSLASAWTWELVWLNPLAADWAGQEAQSPWQSVYFELPFMPAYDGCPRCGCAVPVCESTCVVLQKRVPD